MSNSLQDQLVQAGLANEKKAREAQRQKKAGGKKKGKGANKPQRSEESQEAARAAEQARAEKAERDRQLEAERQARRAEKEREEQVAQIIRSQRLSREGGEVRYHFTDGTRIRELLVTAALQQQLAVGSAVIVRSGKGYEILPASEAERVRELDPERIVTWNTPDGDHDPDDPYADYPVPDDLSW